MNGVNELLAEASTLKPTVGNLTFVVTSIGHEAHSILTQQGQLQAYPLPTPCSLGHTLLKRTAALKCYAAVKRL